MKLRRNTKGLALALLLLTVTACDDINKGLVEVELTELNQKIKTNNMPSSPWAIALMLNELNDSTRLVLGNIVVFSELVPILRKSQIPSFLQGLSDTVGINENGNVVLHDLTPLPPITNQQEVLLLNSIIQPEYQRMLNSDYVYEYVRRGLVGIDNGYEALYCNQESRCYAMILKTIIETSSFDGHVLTLYIQNLIAHNVSTQLRGIEQSFRYHEATVVITKDFSQAVVIDPIVFGNAELKSLKDWLNRINHPDHLLIY